ncbi:anti-phage ATPase IteA [Variovorax boronicumulans]|uniref:anti-phage ATPase IteA n=1 Tax=Variovorax boronicumulans TaxID=436515 RepID=UPI0007815545|nr:anti-phage ATPase IteA [Variovorax boronicumulans]
MEHISEVLKILDGALKSNASLAMSYAGLLADKLHDQGDRAQARMIRERLARAPAAVASAQDAERGVSFSSLPVDGESRLHTVDVSQPRSEDIHLVLPNALERRVEDFLSGVRHYDQLARVGAALPNRMLVYGPPGTGKTQLVRWLAAQLNLPLLTVRCDTLVSSLLGQTSRNLRRVFDYAEHRPCVLFLDEFDALAGARGNERDVGELQRVVIALLQNMDALSASTVLVAATNHERLLDAAVWRRFSFNLPMPLPADDARRALWGRFLGTMVSDPQAIEELVAASLGASGALIEQVSLDGKRDAVLKHAGLIDVPGLFRRLGISMALAKGVALSTEEEEMQWLRQWQPQVFTLRALAHLYDTSTRQITNITKEKADGNSEGSDAASRRKSNRTRRK